jgi:hypothetical protein
VQTAYDDILSTDGLNALTFRDPYAKLCFMVVLASQQQYQRKKIIYIDTDTMFTGYLKAGLLFNKNNGEQTTKNKQNTTVEIYLATECKFESILKDVICSMPDSSIVIFDSLNSFYNIYFKRINISTGSGISKINHLVSFFLMLLVKHGRFLHVPILVTSMIRYKKDTEWILSPSCKRLLRKKGIVNLNIDIKGNDLLLEIIKHPSLVTPKFITYHNSVANLTAF